MQYAAGRAWTRDVLTSKIFVLQGDQSSWQTKTFDVELSLCSVIQSCIDTFVLEPAGLRISAVQTPPVSKWEDLDSQHQTPSPLPSLVLAQRVSLEGCREEKREGPERRRRGRREEDEGGRYNE